MFKSKNTPNNLPISEAVRHCQAEISQAVANSLAEKREGVSGYVQDKYGTVKEKAQHVTGRFLNKKDEAVYQLDRQMNSYNNKLEMMARQWPGQLDRLVHRYPWLALLLVLGVGLILGLFLSPTRLSRR